MSIAPELAKYKTAGRKKEDRFIQEFLIPLLKRLGYFVVNYHSSREHGRDLILAEINRFGQVCFHGLQAKYEDSIGLSDIKEVIDDCEQAFTTPFRHPQTGLLEYISSFFAVNAGSFSPDAQERYFNKLKPMYGANARLIPGNDLVALDRWASINQQAMLAETLAGMVAEIRSNHSRLATDIVPTLQAYVGSPQTTPSPGVRLRDVALGQYLARPIDSLTTDYKAVSDYFDQGRALNLLLDRLVSAGNQQQKIKDANQVINIAPKYVQWGDEIAASARALLQQLGPISGL